MICDAISTLFTEVFHAARFRRVSLIVTGAGDGLWGNGTYNPRGSCIAISSVAERVCVFAQCAGYPVVRNTIRRVLCSTHVVMSRAASINRGTQVPDKDSWVTKNEKKFIFCSQGAKVDGGEDYGGGKLAAGGAGGTKG